MSYTRSGGKMFTKQHFEKIAEILKVTGRLPSTHDPREQIGYALANMFEANEPRFDRQRFLNAADLPAE